MKIGVVHVNTEVASGPYTKLITSNLERAKGSDTEIVHRYVQHLRRATDTAIAYPTLMNKVDVVTQMVELEAEGVDAVMVACSGDPGVAEARSLLHIPVVGPMEAAMGLVVGYGWRFGILTVADRTWSSWLEQIVVSYGFSTRYGGQRQLETPTAAIFTEGFDNPDLVRADIEARAQEFAQMGVEAILIGSAGLSTFATHTGISKTKDPVMPVFDVISVGLKVAELRAELQAKLGVPAVSRAGWFSEFDTRNRERVDALFGWGTPVSAAADR
jgi:Asp/Glu/hydantoin racemase